MTMSPLVIIFAVLACIYGETQPVKTTISEKLAFKNGTTVIFSSLLDNSVITVYKNGDVTTELLKNSKEQLWTIVTHPLDPDALEFKQAVVPYNMLSGYEDAPENPGLFPRPLGLDDRGTVEGQQTWNILIRGRWCLQANGIGHPMDIEDCEDFTAMWQLWQIREVS